MTNKCFICKRSVIKSIYNKLTYLRCDNCDFEFRANYKNTNEFLDFSAHGDYVFKHNFKKKITKFDEYDFRCNKIDKLIKRKKNRIRILDIGCGKGYFLNKYKKKAYIKGLEINESHIKYLKSKKYNFENKDLLNYKPDFKYDLVLLFATLEHLPNIEKYISYLKEKILKKTGSILVDLPSIRDPLSYYYNINNYKKMFYKRYHIYYFSKNSLEKLFKKHGFKIKITLLQQASITNHFHWIYNKTKQNSSHLMSNPIIDFENKNLKRKKIIEKIIDEVDTAYRNKLIKSGISDLLFAEIYR